SSRGGRASLSRGAWLRYALLGEPLHPPLRSTATTFGQRVRYHIVYEEYAGQSIDALNRGC
ncbi:hypothetical protein FOZ63_023031, partial [Perkinsus olseni]